MLRQGPFMDFNIVPSKARGKPRREETYSKTQIIMPFQRPMSVWKGTISAANGGSKFILAGFGEAGIDNFEPNCIPYRSEPAFMRETRGSRAE